jgi:hypothetical protein
MQRLLTAALASALAAAPAAADEFTDVVQSALDAYAEGDVGVTIEELDYAMKLLNDMKAASLAEFLPPAQDGWTREDSADAEGAGMAMAMFGGGTTAAATYRKGETTFTITLVANSPMVSGLGGMLTGMAGMGGGKPIRIQRTQFVMNEGELQGVVDGQVLVSVSGEAPIEDKTAHLEAMDFKAIADF